MTIRSTSPPLSLTQLQRNGSLLALFDRIEDALHSQGVTKQDRYEVLLHLLLAKLYDERARARTPWAALAVQDPRARGWSPVETKTRFERFLTEVVAHYGTGLPRPLSARIGVPAPALAEALSVLAPHRIADASPWAMQDFFMRFARDLYKWDMAQYFTPTPISGFIVEAVNPMAQDLVKDPAIGSGDFLVAAWDRYYGDPHVKPQLFGVDASPTAAQVAELNRILHNASPWHLVVGDSLAGVDDRGPVHHVVICNPPFGRDIRVKEPAVLRRFDLGRRWADDGSGRLGPTSQVLPSQESGILFVETCVRQVLPGAGRVAVVVPNGYLGNRGVQYVALREWLLRNCRVAAVLSFPRFTFKTSGADVSASVLLLERRESPLDSSRQVDDHPVAVELVERVGWDVGVKNGGPVYRRLSSGALELDDTGQPFVDDDFTRVLGRLRTSAANEAFPWLAGRAEQADDEPTGHCVSVRTVVEDPNLCLDPKRHSRKYMWVKRRIMQSRRPFSLGDVVEVVPELGVAEVRARVLSAAYRYVEIGSVGPGTYSPVSVPAWKLPSRARHEATQGDIFVGGIWGSVSKWFMAGKEENLLVTNGFRRLRVVDDSRLLDLVVGLCSEAFAVQMRALALGSDGLAEVTDDDLLRVVLPRVADERVRRKVTPFVERLREGHTSLKATVDDLVAAGRLRSLAVPPRASHVLLV